MSRQPQFSIGKIQNVGLPSKEIGSNKTVVVSVGWAEVTCACGHTWVADERNGLLNVIGGVHVTCPACKASGLVHTRLFRA